MKRRPSTDWPTVAERVAKTIPRHRLDSSVLGWVEKNGRGRRWFVALSGGADSVALLLLLWAHWPERRGRLAALHFDHRLRGPASRADARFCRGLCAALGVPLVIGTWKRPRGATPPSEAEARTARMAFFGQHARVLWLGHHQDDVAETMLMRLARGSGAGGLAAPRPVQPVPRERINLRPLLSIRKADLMAALRDAGATWCEDATNTGTDYFRNRIRLDVVPAWVSAARRDAIGGAARSRELLAEDDAALEGWVDRLAPMASNGDLLLRRLATAPRAVRRRALHRWLLTSRPAVDLSRQAFEALLLAVERGTSTRHSLGREMFAVVHRGRLRFETGKPAAKFQRRVN